MALDKTFFVQFAQTMFKLAPDKEVETYEDGTQYLTCRLGDVVAMVSRSTSGVSFMGLLATAYGLDWVVGEEGELSLVDFAGNRSAVPETLVSSIESYFTHRLTVLTELGF